MQNTKTKLATILLLSALMLSFFPLSAFASTGNIYINPTSLIPPPPISSPLGQRFPAGSPVNLYFGGVTFSGGQFVLYLSTNGFSDIVTRNNQPDIPYSAVFDVVNVTDTLATHVYTAPGGFTWTVGSNWVNGSLPRDVAGGSYFIKAFDGSQTSVAVTDTSLFIDPGVAVVPTSGNAGLSITFSGSAFQLGALLNLSYNIGTGAPVYFQNLTAVGSIGNFSVTMPAPDTLQDLTAGNTTIASTLINFAAAINGTTTVVETTVDFAEFARGLVQIKKTGPTSEQINLGNGYLFGNNTSFDVTGPALNPITGLGVNKVLRLAGNYFAQGNLTTRWDNAVIANTNPTINATGWFNTTITVPPTANGLHNITLIDGNNVVFRIIVEVFPSLTLSPTRGPGGTNVTATGYGFTAPTTTVVNNASIAWPGIATYVGSAFVDATGSFVITFTVPEAAAGGENLITAYENFTGSFVATATATFTVTAKFTVTPDKFNNNASLLVTATGLGFKPGAVYQVNIDNNLLGFAPLGAVFQTGISPFANGTITFSFVGAGFQLGTHAVSLYENNTSTPAAVAGFNVTGDSAAQTLDLLAAINKTTTQMALDLKSINATIVAINGNTATLSTSIGTLTTTIQGVSSSVSGLSSSISGITGQISSISNGMATIQTSVGTITTKLESIDPVIGLIAGDTTEIKTSLGTVTTSLSSINTQVTSIVGDVATIQTDLGTLQGTVTSVNDGVATIKTGVGTMQADVSAIKTDVESTQANTANLSPLVIVAIVLALIAAIAAIASIVLMRRKIAG